MIFIHPVHLCVLHLHSNINVTSSAILDLINMYFGSYMTIIY